MTDTVIGDDGAARRDGRARAPWALPPTTDKDAEIATDGARDSIDPTKRRPSVKAVRHRVSGTIRRRH